MLGSRGYEGGYVGIFFRPLRAMKRMGEVVFVAMSE